MGEMMQRYHQVKKGKNGFTYSPRPIRPVLYLNCEHNYSQHWVLCKLGLTSNHQPIANPSCGSGWTNNFGL
jgi:hypothetical protein